MTKPAMWPILFQYQGPVIGKGFVADVQLCGRLLVEIETNGVWLYGVNPGALAVPAVNIAAGSAAVTKALTAAFVDFAEDASNFDGFKAEVERFFESTDEESDVEWKAAVQAIRNGSLPALSGLPMKSADETTLSVSVTIRPVEDLTPDDNRIDLEDEPTLAAAA